MNDNNNSDEDNGAGGPELMLNILVGRTINGYINIYLTYHSKFSYKRMQTSKLAKYNILIHNFQV